MKDKQNSQNLITNDKKQVHFTPRQLEVLSLWAHKATVTEVAAALGTSKHTVYTQLKRMRKKLGVKRTISVYIYAKKQDLIH